MRSLGRQAGTDAASWARRVGLPLALGNNPRATAQDNGREGLIERVREPQNLEFPFHTLDEFIVPNDRFFVRNHFAAPQLETTTWRLRVTGHVTREIELTYDQLRRLPTETVTATLECAGNSRGLNVPPLPGVAWQQGAVSNAEWTGVPLSAVLDQAGVRPGAVDVILEGADRGEITSAPRPSGTVVYARSLPLAKANRPEVLLALRMNGADLPRPHGFPVRVVVPGWYGMASVKWLTRVIVSDVPFTGVWQTADYSFYERRQGLPVLRPITEMLPKSLIARPRADEAVRTRADYRVHGAAWAGEADVRRVEVSTDGGQTWSEANLHGPARRFAWRLWEYTWRAPAMAGPVTLICRSVDSRGRTQPTAPRSRPAELHDQPLDACSGPRDLIAGVGSGRQAPAEPDSPEFGHLAGLAAMRMPKPWM